MFSLKRSGALRPIAIGRAVVAEMDRLADADISPLPHAYVIAVVEGTVRPTVNGQPLGSDAVDLRDGDLLELGGTQMQFVQI